MLPDANTYPKPVFYTHIGNEVGYYWIKRYTIVYDSLARPIGRDYFWSLNG